MHRKHLCAVVCVSTLAIGLYAGFKLGRISAGLPGQVIRVTQTPPYKPVEIVPDSVDWPRAEPVAVATVEPPTNKERKRIKRDFDDLDLSRNNLLGKFTLPDLPDGGRAVVSVPMSDSPEPVSLIVRANPPPLFRIRWEPEVSAWAGWGHNSTENGTFLPSWSLYVSAPNLLCIRDKVCGGARAGREHRPWGEGWVAEAGAAIRF